MRHSVDQWWQIWSSIGLLVLFLEVTHLRPYSLPPWGYPVALMPRWCSCVCTCSVTKLVKWGLDGKRYGNFDSFDIGALCIRPPHPSNLFLSKSNLSCHIIENRCDCKLWISAGNCSCLAAWIYFTLHTVSSAGDKCTVELEYLMFRKCRAYALTANSLKSWLNLLTSITFATVYVTAGLWLGLIWSLCTWSAHCSFRQVSWIPGTLYIQPCWAIYVSKIQMIWAAQP